MNKGKGKSWLLAFRVLVTLAAIAYVCWKMSSKWDQLALIFARPWSAIQWLLLIASILLMPLNYALESQKWRLMVRPFYPTLGLWQATIAVFAGMAAGIFTPNRIGEYAGRIVFLREGRRWEAIVATFVDRICQLLVTLLCGLLALGALLILYDPSLPARILGDPMSRGIFIFLSTVLGGIALLLLLAPRWLAARIPGRWNKATWIRKTRFAMQHLPIPMVIHVTGLALVRYIVFSSQYLLLMYVFAYDGGIGAGYLMIALIFLGKSVLPVMGVLELGVRESVALLVMTAFAQSESTALSSTLLLYLINILLPTLIGVVAMQRIRILA